MMFKIYHGLTAFSDGQHTMAAVAVSGTAVQLESATGNTLVAATGTPLGFLMKSVTADGPSDFELEHLNGIDAHEVITGSNVPVLGFSNGIILTDVVAAGMTGATTVGEKLKISAGLWDVAASGDVVCGQLLATDAESTTGLYMIQLLTGGTIEAE
jgi:hypothetical protein